MRSLRARLSLGVGLVIAVVLGVSGVLISNYTERTAREALDDRLRRTAELSRATAVDAVQNARARDRPAAGRGAPRHRQLAAAVHR